MCLKYTQPKIHHINYLSVQLHVLSVFTLLYKGFSELFHLVKLKLYTL